MWRPRGRFLKSPDHAGTGGVTVKSEASVFGRTNFGARRWRE
jgi:hypothetical protein